jgi:hypothetical protein
MPDWSSWDLWAKDIAPVAGGALRLLLLAIRTRAITRQAETAAKRHKEQTAADRERRITENFAKDHGDIDGARARAAPWPPLQSTLASGGSTAKPEYENEPAMRASEVGALLPGRAPTLPT